MSDKPSAFVIMPFDEKLAPVYTLIIKPVLEGAGFDVERADDIESQQSIIKDILDKITSSDLIVADLTDLNANVFYELGLAHALRKKVILLTQSVDEVPFDLKPYRLLEYSEHFSKFEDAKEKLKGYADGCRAGTMEFGNPVTDYVPIDAAPNLDTTTHTDDAQSETLEKEIEEESPSGFLDHTVALTEGYERIGEIAAGVTNDMVKLTTDIEGSTSDMNSINANPNASSPRAARNVARRLSVKVNSFNSNMKTANTEFSDVLEKTEEGLEMFVTFLLQNPDVEESQRSKFNENLGALENTGTQARDGCLSFATSMDNVPNVESRLNRAKSVSSEELRAMAANMERLRASVARAKRRMTLGQ